MLRRSSIHDCKRNLLFRVQAGRASDLMGTAQGALPGLPGMFPADRYPSERAAGSGAGNHRTVTIQSLPIPTATTRMITICLRQITENADQGTDRRHPMIQGILAAVVVATITAPTSGPVALPTVAHAQTVPMTSSHIFPMAPSHSCNSANDGERVQEHGVIWECKRGEFDGMWAWEIVGCAPDGAAAMSTCPRGARR